MEDDSGPIVMDNGSSVFKAGFGGDDEPLTVFPSIVGRPRDASDTRLMDSYVGDDAQSKRELLALTYPIEDGIITHWDEMEKIWQYAFLQMGATSKNHGVLMADAPLNTYANREKMAQIMFETFNVPQFQVQLQPVLVLYTGGATTGVVLSSGGSLTHVVPIYQGVAFSHAILRLDLAGKELTEYLVKLLGEKCYEIATCGERQVVESVKHNRCYVALDYEKELENPGWSSAQELSYELPDGRILNVGNERFSVPEALFQPSLAGIPSPGIHQMMFDSVNKCDSRVHSDLYSRIVIGGGNTMFPGLAERMQKEMSALVPPSKRKLEVVAPPERKHAVWLGGSIISSLGTYRDRWISREEYDERGPAIVRHKYF